MDLQKLKQRTKLGNSGFSLVELIIVIAIMAILIAVLAPMFIRYVERSRISRDIQAAAQVGNAMKAAASDPNISLGLNFQVTFDPGTGVAVTGGDSTGDGAQSLEDTLGTLGNITGESSTFDAPITFDLNTANGAMVVAGGTNQAGTSNGDYLLALVADLNS